MDIKDNKKKVIAQFICLLLSMGLWFYITNIENPLKTYELNRVPVELLNVDKLTESKLALSPNQNLYVTLKLEGTSQQLFGIDRSDFKITVDLDEYALKKGEVKLLVNVVESPLNVTIKNGSGLGVTVYLEDLVEKEVAVKSEIEVIAKSNYHVSKPVLKPETVVVYGAESLVNKVDSVVAKGEEDSITEGLVKDYKITAVDENGVAVDGVQLSRNWVEVTIDIAEGKTIPITANYTGQLKSGIRLKSIRPKIEAVGVTGPQALLDATSEITTAAIDLSTIEDSTTITTNLNIPDGLYLYDGNNEVEVEIVVEKVVSKEFTIPYTLIGQNADISIAPNDTNIIVKVSGFADVLDSLSEANFKAELDVSQYTEAGEVTKKPTVTLVNADGVTIDSVTEVKLVITKDIATDGEDQNSSDNS